MKRSIIIFFISFHISSFPQTSPDLSFLTSYFKDVYKYYTVKYNGRSYKFTEFDSVIDGLLNNLLARPDIKQVKIGIPLPQKRTPLLQNIIDDIIVSGQKGDFNTSMAKIVSKINSLRSSEKIYAFSYLFDYLLYTNDQVQLKNLAESTTHLIEDTTIHSLNDRQKANFLKTTGDFFNRFAQREAALEFYLEAAFMFDTLKAVYDLGQVQENIADLYFSRDIDIYKSKGIQYLLKASESFGQIHNHSASINSRLKAASKMIWNKEPFYFRDMIEPADSFHGIANYQEIIERTSQYKDSANNQYILHSAYLSTNDHSSSKPIDYHFNTNTVLGGYFGKHQDWISSEAYFKTAVINALLMPEIDIKTVIQAFNQLSWMYAVSKDESKCLYYWDKAFTIAKQGNLTLQKSWLLFSKSHHLNLMGKGREGIKWAKEGAIYAEGLIWRDYQRLYELNLRCLFELYGNLNLVDSSNYYYEKLASLRSDYLWEFEHLSNLELNYAEDINAHYYNSLHNDFHDLDKRFLVLKKKEANLNNEITDLTALSLNLKNQVGNQRDSIASLDSILRVNKDSASHYQNISMQNISEANKALYARNWAIGAAIMLFALSVFSYFNWRRFKRKTALAKIELQKNKEESVRLYQENEENNYKLKLEKNTSDMALLSTLAINHDLDKFIPLLPKYIDNMDSETKAQLSKAVQDFEAYHQLTKQLGSSLTNTIKKEVEIGKKAASVYLYMSSSKTVPYFKTNFENNSEIENIEIPKNLLSEFIVNSIKNGAVGKSEIHISILANKESNGYSFLIEDNGVGFTDLGLENKPTDKGVNLVVRQVANFNESNRPYKIVFSPKNIISKENRQGVQVTFKVVKNNA